MFCSTFYSYKGGVGRTLALANVAVAIARRRKKVLVVDFDLEAPGLTTLDVFRGAKDKPGIIDFVQDFRGSGSAPEAAKFIHQCAIPSAESDLSAPSEITIDVMPAGADSDYPHRFGTIDWAHLYEEESGFLLIEDLRAQWSSLNYDYVFIDSRTGLTDVGGICTRQLPDLTVIVFFPNEQNLAGLKQVVEQIKGHSARQQAIDLLFAASRLPKLDDEDGVLKGWLTRFQNELEYDVEQLSKIDHYDSLRLLDQDLFVLSRPKSGLAKQYVSLANALARRNVEDADGALDFIVDLSRPRLRGRNWFAGIPDPLTRERERDHLDLIGKKHARDYVVQYALAEFYSNLHSFDDAERAVDLGLQALGNTAVTKEIDPSIPVSLHQLRLRLLRELHVTDSAPAISSAEAILQDSHADVVKIVDALKALANVDPERLPQPGKVLALSSRDPVKAASVATSLAASSNSIALNFAVEIASDIIEERRGSEIDSATAFDLMMIFIAGRRFESAIQVGELIKEDEAQFPRVSKAFNLAIAKWGSDRSPDPKLFSRVLELAPLAINYQEGANFNQCLALSNAVVGNTEESMKSLQNARQAMTGMVREFSCWTYRTVSRTRFLADCDAIEKFANGDGAPPEVVRHGG